MRFKLLLLLIFPFILAQKDCSQAPPAMRSICQQINMWSSNTRGLPSTARGGASAPGIAGLAAVVAPLPSSPSNAYDCMDIACICQFFSATSGASCSVYRGLRREYRVMTDDERRRYHTAMWTIKNNGDYNELSRIHSSFETSPGAHSGPAFLPWHREYIKRLEIALRRVDPSISLPYWDSSLDSSLPNPRDSVLWSSELMGQAGSDGSVTTGAFRNWRTTDGSRIFRRQMGQQGALLTQNDVNTVLNSGVNDMLANTAPESSCPNPAGWTAFEYIHGTPHTWIGGDMLVTTMSTNDPIFFNHHSFIDYLWEQWRQTRQSRSQREVQFPVDNLACSSDAHFGGNTMQPFLIFANTDGLSNRYTDNLYTYAPRPTCSAGNPNCGSKYLFCDLSHGEARCASKVMTGGLCTGYLRGEEVCYLGVCNGGRCQAVQETTAAPVMTTPPVAPNPDGTCFNENECCSSWAAAGECRRNSDYMRQWCPASCGICTPRYQNAECNDRHSQCRRWSSLGECTKNQGWMRENCRQSCGRCSVTRAQACQRGGTPATTSAPASSDCLNNHYCCPAWSRNGYCTSGSFASYMTTTCRSACNYCRGPDTNQCADLSGFCSYWAGQGQCSTSRDYMLENCKRSCGRCDLANITTRLRACGFQAFSRNSQRRQNVRSLGRLRQDNRRLSNKKSVMQKRRKGAQRRRRHD